MGQRRDIQLEILRRLLETDSLSVRQLARDLHIPSSNALYHLKRLVKMGVLMKRTWTDEAGDVVSQFVEYAPQPIFSMENALVMDIQELMGRIVDPAPEKVGNIVAFLLKLCNVSITLS